MSVVLPAAHPAPTSPSAPGRVTGGAPGTDGARETSKTRRAWLVTAAPPLFVLANALAFWLIRPGVNDLWAARARANAVSHGVGLFYWFSWFAGGATPGNYSVISPYLCAWIGTELVGALSAVALAALITVAVTRTRHPQLAAAVGALGVTANLWSGRVPFLLGSAIGVGAVIVLLQRRRAATVGLMLLTIAASPVAAAFVVLGVSGTFLTTRTRAWRPIIAWAAGAALVAALLDALVFGAPGPEPFSLWLVLEVLAGLLVLLIARPPDHVRTTIYVALLLTTAVAIVPNGLGANIARFDWFCLPVLVAALSLHVDRRWIAAGVLPIVLAGAGSTVNDLVNADSPVSSPGYYHPLARELKTVPHLADYRVEVVNHGAHAAYDALLGTASLARGWETQEDAALNGVLLQDPVDPVAYKLWLDDNAVGYVAMPATTTGAYPEYTLVAKHLPGYLRPYWHDKHWTLYRVMNPSPIVERPGSLLGHTQSSMTVRVPCACALHVRLRWSKYLVAPLKPASKKAPLVQATIEDDGSGWTVLTAPRAGTYVLRGSVANILH